MHSDSVTEVLERYKDELMAIEHVVAVGEGLCDDGPCIRVYLSEADAAAEAQIPGELDGVTVETVVSGEFKAGV
jgi:hypothetical protein